MRARYFLSTADWLQQAENGEASRPETPVLRHLMGTSPEERRHDERSLSEATAGEKVALDNSDMI
jgi:hypothetical protein